MATTFERDEKATYNIVQRFADTTFKQCPFCGKIEPKWLTKEDWHLFDKTYCIKCPECGSIIEAPESDVTGLAFTTHTPQGRKKKRDGKYMREIYICVKQVGFDVRNQENILLEGAEIPLGQFKAWIDKHPVEPKE